jgi:hypothetical protein
MIVRASMHEVYQGVLLVMEPPIDSVPCDSSQSTSEAPTPSEVDRDIPAIFRTPWQYPHPSFSTVRVQRRP